MINEFVINEACGQKLKILLHTVLESVWARAVAGWCAKLGRGRGRGDDGGFLWAVASGQMSIEL